MWKSDTRQLVLSVPQADYYLATPGLDDFVSWRQARQSSRAHLQPFEPVWKEDVFHRTNFRRFVRQSEYDLGSDGGVVLFLKLASNDEVIGGINLRNIRRGSADMGTLGYWIAAEFGGAGRMKKAVGCVTDFGFRHYDLHRIEAACVPENLASAAVLLANGYREEGFAHSYLKINGAWRDHRLFARVRPDV